jgi:transposase
MRTFQYRLYPNKDQQAKLWQHANKLNWMYNYFLNKRIENYKKGIKIGQKEQQAEDLRKKNEQAKEEQKQKELERQRLKKEQIQKKEEEKRLKEQERQKLLEEKNNELKRLKEEKIKGKFLSKTLVQKIEENLLLNPISDIVLHIFSLSRSLDL